MVNSIGMQRRLKLEESVPKRHQSPRFPGEPFSSTTPAATSRDRPLRSRHPDRPSKLRPVRLRQLSALLGNSRRGRRVCVLHEVAERDQDKRQPGCGMPVTRAWLVPHLLRGRVGRRTRGCGSQIERVCRTDKAEGLKWLPLFVYEPMEQASVQARDVSRWHVIHKHLLFAITAIHHE